MPITIADESTANAFESASISQEVRGPNGAVLGQFIPAALTNISFAEFGVTVEELQRQLHDPNAKWVSPEAVMERLREIDRCSP